MRAIRNALTPVLVALTAAAALLIRLLYPQPVGVADSYDGPRLMCHLKVDMHLAHGAVRLRDYVTFRYDRTPRAACSHSHLGSIQLPRTPYASSQILLLYAGRVLSHALHLPGYLDLRAVGAVCCLLAGGAFGLLYWALTCRRRYRLLLCALLLVVLADATFIDFAISPFSEIAAVIGLLYLLPGVALLMQPGRRRVIGLAVVTAAGSFLVTAKTQDIVLVLPLAALLVMFAVPLPKAGPGLRRLDTLARGRLIPLTAVAILAACAFGVTTRVDSFNDQLTKGNFVTAVLLPTSDDPEADIAALGGPSWIADKLTGKPAWCTTKAMGEQPEFKQFIRSLSHRHIATFLAARPDRVFAVLDTAAEHVYDPRPDYTLCSQALGLMTTSKLGNHGYAPNRPPRSLDHRFTPVTSALGLLSGGGFAPLIALWAIPATAAAVILFRRPNGREAAVMTLLLGTVAVMQFAVCAFADGIDTSKHLNLAVFAGAAAWATAAAAAVLARAVDPSSAAAPQQSEADQQRALASVKQP